MVLVEMRSVYSNKSEQKSMSAFTVYSFLAVWMVTGFFIYCGFLKKADSVNIQCRRLEQSLAHFAMTCNINGQIALKSLQKKVAAANQYPNQIFAGGTASQQHQQQVQRQQQQQQAYQHAVNQQRAAAQQTLVAGGTGLPRQGNY